MLNQVSILGRITKEIEVKEVGKAKNKVVSFCIATDDIEKDEKGEHTTSFFNVTAWNNQAEYLGKYAKKGQAVIVTGRLKQRAYTNKEGNKVNAIEIIANDTQLLRGKDSEDSTLPF